MKKSYRTLLLLPLVAGGLAILADRELPAKAVSEDSESKMEASRVVPSTVLHESDRLAAPTDVEVMGDLLVIADDFADHPLRVLRRSDGAIEQSFGGRGKGPREFESAWSIDVVDPEGEFMVMDVMLQRITWVDLQEDFQEGRWVGDRSVKLQSETMLLEAAWAPRGLVGVGIFRQGRIGHFAADGSLLRTTGPTPLDGMEVPPEIRQQAYQSRLKANPERTRWAVATRFADRLEIYDASGTLLTEGARPYGFEPRYEAVRSAQMVSMASGDETRFGYLDLATTGDRIYALFSGRTRAEGRPNYGNAVHVFDWEGRLVDVLELDSHVIALAVDPSGDTLYGIRHAPFPAVLEFDLGGPAG